MIMRTLLVLGVVAVMIYIVAGLAASKPPSNVEVAVIAVFLIIIFSLSILIDSGGPE